MEAAFEKIPGVFSATSGYTGGTATNPTYGQVCSGTTGHCEAVEVDYDPAKVSYDKLLSVFWDEHDPTADTTSLRGGQYRSAIFYHNKEQEVAAKASKDKLQVKLGRPIHTQILPAPKFWQAEDYHQNYYKKTGGGFCR